MKLSPKQLHEKNPFVSESLIYLWVAQKELPHYRLGGKGRRGRIVIDEDDFAAFLAARKVEAGSEEPPPPSAKPGAFTMLDAKRLREAWHPPDVNAGLRGT